ncbi:MAG: hypothetical protein Q8K00_06170 [Syntrophales bacterium]|nr:hypothetical protein [Syntrophales bacterium]
MKRSKMIWIVGLLLLLGGYASLFTGASYVEAAEATAYGAHGAKQEANLTVERCWGMHLRMNTLRAQPTGL